MNKFIFSALFLFVVSIPNSSQAQRKKGRYKFITITTFEQFSKLKLVPSDEVADTFLTELIEELQAGVSEQTYRFVFKRIKPAKRTEPFIEQAKKGVLLGFVRSPSIQGADLSEQEPGTSWESTDSEAIIDAIVGSEGIAPSTRAISTATKGVCGPIAIAHSLVRLGLRTKEQTFQKQFLNFDNFQQLLQFQGKFIGMPLPRYEQAHKDLGATICEDSGVTSTKSRRQLSAFNTGLANKMNSTNPIWDCGIHTLTVLSTNQVSLNHIEHVTGVKLRKTKRGTAAIITTVNGLDQGDKKTTVPSDPGTNTWSSIPNKGKGSFRFAGSTSPKAKSYVKGIPLATNVRWVCCRKP